MKPLLFCVFCHLIQFIGREMALQHKNETKENKPKKDHTFGTISAIRPMPCSTSSGVLMDKWPFKKKNPSKICLLEQKYERFKQQLFHDCRSCLGLSTPCFLMLCFCPDRRPALRRDTLLSHKNIALYTKMRSIIQAKYKA